MKRFTLDETAARIDRRLAEGVRIPPLEDLRNDGTRRTTRKHRLLQTLDRVAREQDRQAPFAMPK